MNDLKTVVDHASTQGLQWWLSLLGVLILGGIVFGVRYIIKDRERTYARLDTITDRHIQTVENLSEVVANNTTALVQNSAALKEVSEAVAWCRQKNR